MVETTIPTPDEPKPDEAPKHESSEEMVAETKLLDSQRALIEARWSFADRMIMRGVIPLALLVGGPVATYYFHSRAEKSDDGVSQLKQLVEKNEKIVGRLEQMLVIATARTETRSFGRQEFARRIAHSTAGVDFQLMREDVARVISARVKSSVGGGDGQVEQAVTGAVDEIVPEFEAQVRALGGKYEAPPETPRFTTEQKK